MYSATRVPFLQRPSGNTAIKVRVRVRVRDRVRGKGRSMDVVDIASTGSEFRATRLKTS